MLRINDRRLQGIGAVGIAVWSHINAAYLVCFSRLYPAISGKLSWFGRGEKKLMNALNDIPIEPKHSRPTSLTGDKPPSSVREEEHRFFADFDKFGDLLNKLYETIGPWRLQELADTKFRRYSHFGRRYSVFYNHADIGVVEIHAMPGYDAETKPEVITEIEISYARLLPFYQVVAFLEVIAGNTAAGSVAKATIDRALLASVWDATPANEGGGKARVYLAGSAARYLRWRAEEFRRADQEQRKAAAEQRKAAAEQRNAPEEQRSAPEEQRNSSEEQRNAAEEQRNAAARAAIEAVRAQLEQLITD
ncbi:MAG TPA: hypothetical protein VGJ20_31475 [Xanthobacteraceae bacterium]